MARKSNNPPEEHKKTLAPFSALYCPIMGLRPQLLLDYLNQRSLITARDSGIAQQNFQRQQHYNHLKAQSFNRHVSNRYSHRGGGYSPSKPVTV